MQKVIDIHLPKMHAAQAAIDAGCKRFNIIRAGRRFGKDVILERRRIRSMLHKPAPYGWFAPTYRMMRQNYREIENRLSPVIARAAASEYRLELINGATLDFWSMDNINAARGRKYAGVTINEAAFAANLMDGWNYVIRPTLADLQGGADLGSTPKGLNDYFALWSKAADDPEWARFHYTTYDNPYIPPGEIDALKKTMAGMAFQQEIMAEFLEGGSFFNNVENACVIEKPDDPAQHIGHRFVAGLDWALTEDFTVLTIGCATCNRTVDWWRGNRMDFIAQREIIQSRLARWPECGVLPERNSIGQPNIELLAAAGVRVLTGPDGGLGFNTTASSKPQLIQRLAAGLEHDGLLVPREYADELRAYEVTLSTHPKFSAPAGMHDDRVISLALTWWAATSIVNDWAML